MFWNKGKPTREADPQPSRKIRAMRKATGAATRIHSNGGGEKQGAYRPKPVTLPTLDTARRITKE